MFSSDITEQYTDTKTSAISIILKKLTTFYCIPSLEPLELKCSE